MRRLVVTAIVLSLGAVVAGCGKSSSSGDGQAAAPTPAVPAPTPEQMKATLATLPAPYNTADLANGQAKFALCASCHTITPGGPNMTGPNLFGIMGHKAGVHANYNYSAALKDSGWVWEPAKLDHWLENPRTTLPGTKMSFIGLRDPKDRTDVIAYLMVNSPAPAP
ncbi:cytochrome c family protein [Phenylobacterium sp. LjRoot219]|uniref:c-type cytochrome n=1 Tax=Phenylobacterium sp. LjRoot219 TaxID=3342283 RepID=UPI003ECD8B3E